MLSRKHFSVEKHIEFNILSVCLLPWVFSIQCARTIFPSVACLTLKYISTLSHMRQDFRKINLCNKMCFGFLYKSFSFVWKPSPNKKKSAKYDHKCRLVSSTSLFNLSGNLLLIRRKQLNMITNLDWFPLQVFFILMYGWPCIVVQCG